MESFDMLNLTADIVSAHVSNNSVAVGDVANLVQRVHGALSNLNVPLPSVAPEAKKAAVSIRASIKPDYLICMECGAKQKMLKRHLATAHAMTPAQYRSDYGLPADYPMSSPNYSKQRGDMARAHGLGRKPKQVLAEAGKTKAGSRKRLGLKRVTTVASEIAPDGAGKQSELPHYGDE